jgi:hypothetical protein
VPATNGSSSVPALMPIADAAARIAGMEQCPCAVQAWPGAPC